MEVRGLIALELKLLSVKLCNEINHNEIIVTKLINLTHRSKIQLKLHVLLSKPMNVQIGRDHLVL